MYDNLDNPVLRAVILTLATQRLRECGIDWASLNCLDDATMRVSQQEPCLIIINQTIQAEQSKIKIDLFISESEIDVFETNIREGVNTRMREKIATIDLEGELKPPKNKRKSKPAPAKQLNIFGDSING